MMICPGDVLFVKSYVTFYDIVNRKRVFLKKGTYITCILTELYDGRCGLSFMSDTGFFTKNQCWFLNADFELVNKRC